MKFKLKNPFVEAYRAEKEQQVFFSSGAVSVPVGHWVVLGQDSRVMSHKAFCELYEAPVGDKEAARMMDGPEVCRHGVALKDPDVICKRCSNQSERLESAK